MDTMREALAQMVRSLPAGSAELASLAWTVVAGPDIARRTRAERLVDKTLFVSVCDADWQRQLEQLKPELASALREVLGADAIESISFRLRNTGTRHSQGDKENSEKTEK